MALTQLPPGAAPLLARDGVNSGYFPLGVSKLRQKVHIVRPRRGGRGRIHLFHIGIHRSERRIPKRPVEYSARGFLRIAAVLVRPGDILQIHYQKKRIEPIRKKSQSRRTRSTASGVDRLLHSLQRRE